MPTIYIDDKAYEVPEGDNVLQACLSAGIDLPYFCWHPEMGSVGACRQCALVQFRDKEDTRGRIVMGCMTPVADGARFSMKGQTASEFRKNVVESLMLNHPHDCPVCGEGGECHLQDMTVMVGHRDRRYRGKKNTHNNQYLGPLINHEMNRCISCYRCTRFYNDYAGGTDLSAQGAHDHVYFGRQQDGILESEFAGNLVEVCPTGVFTDKPLVNDYTRKWDMQSAPSICTGCALGCNTLPSERYGKLKRIHNRFNNEVNGYFLCDRGRYGGNYVNDEKRALFSGLRNEHGSYDAINNKQAISTLANWCKDRNKLAAIGSPRASLETNYLLSSIVGKKNYHHGMGDHEGPLITQISQILQSSSVTTPSMRQAEAADAVLILGEDVTNTAPRLALALRQSVRNLAKKMATDMRIEHWQDEAVRVLAQDKLSPLYIVAVADTRLDDIAEQTWSMKPNEIARFGFAIAAEIDSSRPPVNGFDENFQQSIKNIAHSLKEASQPLIVSGTACQSAAVVQAAAAISQALDNRAAMLSFCLPEVNSMGTALMQTGVEASLADLCQRAAEGNIETLIVAENDLYRRASRAQIDALLGHVKNLVVLDVIDNPSLSQSALAMPAASFAEAQGTLVSSEGRAQRYYPVFVPPEQRRPSWRYLRELGQVLNIEGFSEFESFDKVSAQCAADFPSLAGIVEASPLGSFRDRGVKIPRQTHRYSGRTAMLADKSVHEPKQPVDQETPLSYSMEGANGKQHGALIPFVWSPGWNSNQSIHKFQSEVGGALQGGTPGKRLIEPSESIISQDFQIPSTQTSDAKHWQLVPLYRIFGSDELSARSPAIDELAPSPQIEITPKDAEKLNVNNGDGLVVSQINSDTTVELEVKLNASLAEGCVGYVVGLTGGVWMPPHSMVSLSKASNWINSAVKAQNSIVTEPGGTHV